ncbi:hypothetical protein LTSEHVI_0428, partial [Salmonella enterica subsp. enterica serovar Hvittingfoss str. A4-620]
MLLESPKYHCAINVGGNRWTVAIMAERRSRQ